MQITEIKAYLEFLRQEGRLRQRSVSPLSLTDLSSNDYLGIGADLTLRQGFIQDQQWNLPPFASTGSPLLSGFSKQAELLERELESFMGRSCLLLNSGFDANAGLMQALGDKHTLILADKLCHASLLDGMALADAKCLRFAHNDLEHLKALYQRYSAQFKAVLIVTEAVFSMDGDRAPLTGLVDFKHTHQDKVMLYVDEAHSFFIYGKGRGLCHELQLLPDVDFLLCTLGKAFGGTGAFVCCQALWKEYFINTLRPYIFSTALPPVLWAWDRHVLVHNDLFCSRREYLFTLISKLKAQLLPLADCGIEVDSQILSLVTGSNERAQALSSWLSGFGFQARPIRYPTVPKGKARVRVALNARINETELRILALAITDFWGGKEQQAAHDL